MHWTTPAPTLRIPAPPLATSRAEYVRAIKALMTYIHPLTAQLVPLFAVYKAYPAPTPDPYSLDAEIGQTEFEIIHAHIALCFREMEMHYREFLALYGYASVGSVKQMADGMEEVGYEAVATNWKDLLFIMEDEATQKFVGWNREAVVTKEEDGKDNVDLGRKRSVVRRLGEWYWKGGLAKGTEIRAPYLLVAYPQHV